MTPDRQKELLLAASKAFEEGSDPFSTSWLNEHNVSLDECCDLSCEIACALRMYAVMK